MNRATSPLIAVGLLVLVVGAGVALDVALPAPATPPVELGDARTAVSGAWYCAAGRSDAENELLTVAATPPGQPTSSAVRVDVLADGQVSRGAELEVFPGAVDVERIAASEADLAIAARWWRTPSVVGRIWRRNVTGEPSGILEGACEPEAGTRWYLPGVSTAGGAQARIVLANPFGTDAAVGISLYTEAGIETPELLKNVSIPSQSVRVIPLNDHAPERQDLGAVVTARAGRVVAEGWQSVDPAVGGVEGLSLAKLAHETATEWTIPWLPGDHESWAWVLNPSDRAAVLEITVHGPNGGTPLADLSETSIPPGSLQRIDLRGVLPEGVAQGAVTFASANGVPVAVSTGTIVRSEDVAKTGVAVQLGQPAPDVGWTIITGSNDGRGEALHVVNPSSSPAVVDVTVVGELSVHAPDPMQDLVVPAGTALDLDLRAQIPTLDRHAVFVTADEGEVIAGIRSFSFGRLDLVAHAGVPSRAWRGAEDVPLVVRAPGLTGRLGTRRGPALSPEPTPAVPTATPVPTRTAPGTGESPAPPTEPAPSLVPTDPAQPAEPPGS